VPAEVPVLVSIFNTRLNLLESQIPAAAASEVAHQAIADLRAMLGRIPRDSFPVRKVWAEIAAAWDNSFWTLLTPAKIEFLRFNVAPSSASPPRSMSLPRRSPARSNA